MSIYDRDQSGWLWLIRAHDHIWADRCLPLEHRIEVCRMLHELSLRCDPLNGESPAAPPLPIPYRPTRTAMVKRSPTPAPPGYDFLNSRWTTVGYLSVTVFPLTSRW